MKDSPERIEQVSLGFDLEEEPTEPPVKAKPAKKTAQPKPSAVKSAQAEFAPEQDHTPAPKVAPAAKKEPAAESRVKAKPADAAPAAGNGAPPDPEGEADVIKVSELGNTEAGCWKKLSDGTRHEISEAEWRKELKRLFSKDGAGGD